MCQSQMTALFAMDKSISAQIFQCLALSVHPSQNCFLDLIGVRSTQSRRLPVLQVELKNHSMLFDVVEEVRSLVETRISSRLKRVEGDVMNKTL